MHSTHSINETIICTLHKMPIVTKIVKATKHATTTTIIIMNKIQLMHECITTSIHTHTPPESFEINNNNLGDSHLEWNMVWIFSVIHFFYQHCDIPLRIDGVPTRSSSIIFICFRSGSVHLFILWYAKSTYKRAAGTSHRDFFLFEKISNDLWITSKCLDSVSALSFVIIK